jgi:3-dehydroquinate dehydratase-1
LGKNPELVKRALPGIKTPILITARHPAEGGLGRLSATCRRDLLSEFLLRADAIDVELRSVGAMSGLLEEARRRRATRIVSFHDFHRTPSLRRLREVLRRSIGAGADIVKIATHLRGPGDLAVLLILQSTAKVPLATMGMGPLGKVSRLVLAAAGSRLNYGYLDKPQVAGQWPALELARRLEEILP